jgi:hypothetical protein
MDLGRELTGLSAEVSWPQTPRLRPQLVPRRRDLRRPLLAAVALALVALAAALAVPQSRAAILRFFHLGAASVQLVERLPAAQERPLGADLGPVVPAAAARGALHQKLLLPPLSPPPPLHVQNEIVSLLLRYQGETVLLSEVYDAEGILLKKLAGSGTRVEPVRVAGRRGLWLSGGPHVFFFPGAPPRIAGNVLLWQSNSLTLRLEGRTLTSADAERFAQSLRR